MDTTFHLSLPVPDIERSVKFFTLLGGTVTHRDESGYVNIDLGGTQITLACGDAIPEQSSFHFGLNVGLEEFAACSELLQASPFARVVSLPKTVDVGTALERRKMYVRCPAGYLFELKGYPGVGSGAGGSSRASG